MTVIIFIVAVFLVMLVFSIYRYLQARFDIRSDRLTRIEDALGSEDWIAFWRTVPGTDPDELEHQGILGRLERIEAPIDSMARARQQVKRLMREMDEASKGGTGGRGSVPHFHRPDSRM